MEKNHVVVTGDISLDCNIYVGNRKSPEDKGLGTHVRRKGGGSYLLFKVISETLKFNISDISESIKDTENHIEDKKGKGEDISDLLSKSKNLGKKKEIWKKAGCSFGIKPEIFESGDIPSNIHTYSTLNKKKYIVPKQFQNTKGEELEAWKVAELLGFGSGSADMEKDSLKELYKKSMNKVPENPGLLVIDDGGNFFRNLDEGWKHLLFDGEISEDGKKKSLDQIILKTGYPLGHGRLFQELTSRFKDKLTIITSIDEIRKADVLVSKGISWEQTALDLVYELVNNKSIQGLTNCKRLIISMKSEGALYLEFKDNEIFKCRLVFDPEYLEGEWTGAKAIPGDVIGKMTCFTAAITYSFIESMLQEKWEGNFNIETAITKALSAVRKYKITGHGNSDADPGFSFESVAHEIIYCRQQFASAFVPVPGNYRPADENGRDGFKMQNWTILAGNYLQDPVKKSLPLFDTAFRFALLGEKELANTPLLRINGFVTYDRREIEAIRNIKNLINDYLKNDPGEKPLSLAVFGMPGSGKSFAVKQLARNLDLPFLEFNLSQFDHCDLDGAFHQVRDQVLKGKTPIVFWDEFDSKAYEWLQYLLAPMQDGQFQEGQLTHPIGKCIFIFAGGTSYTFQTFGIEEPVYPEENDEKLTDEYKLKLQRFNDFILKKGPDFKSRLSGYLNVQGPNQLEKLDADGKVLKNANEVVYDEDDILYPVRRALFMRGILRMKVDQPLNIDYGLLNALISTRKYLHGARSLEKLLIHLKTKNNSKLQRSNLPAPGVLSMLVDNNFKLLLNEDKSLQFQAFSIAPYIHENWCKAGDKEGWKMEYHKDYKFLPSHMKDDNIAAARRIPKVLNVLNVLFTTDLPKPLDRPFISNILNRIGILNYLNLRVVQQEDSDLYYEVNFKNLIRFRSIMQLLAIEEHRGWVETRKKDGWRYDNKRNDDKKFHNCIAEWGRRKIYYKVHHQKTQNVPGLSIKDKKKDMDAIRQYVEVLNKAGLVIAGVRKNNDLV